MRKIVIVALLVVVPGCKSVQNLTVQVTVSPTLHLDGIGRGVEVQAAVKADPKKK